MKRLHEKTEWAILQTHQRVPLRVYVTDPLQGTRIKKARELVVAALKAMHEDGKIAHERRKIIELGCNSCDISGHFSWGHDVTAYEVAPACVEYIAKNYPWVKIKPEDFTKVRPEDCDILVLCEVLEHLADPLAAVRAWMPRAKFCVLSSPLCGDLNGDLSSGEHVWSFDPEDFEAFFREGQHIPIRGVPIEMGGYTINLSISKRREEPKGETE